MTGEEGTEQGRPVRRHARPAEPAAPWPGGGSALPHGPAPHGAVPNGAVPNGSAAPGGPVSGGGPRPADDGMPPDRAGTVPNYALPPNPGGPAPGRHGAPGNARGGYRAPDHPPAGYRAPDNPPISYGTPENYGARGDNGAQPGRGAPSGGYGPDRGYPAPLGGYGPSGGSYQAPGGGYQPPSGGYGMDRRGYGAPNGPAAPPGSHGSAPAAPQPGREQPARPPDAPPSGRHAGQDGSADGPSRPQGPYQGTRRSPEPIDPNGSPGPSRPGAWDARPPGGPAPRSPGRPDPLTDPSYARPGSSLPRPAQPQPGTSGYGRPQPDGSRPGAQTRPGYPRDGGYPDDGRGPRDRRNRRGQGNPRNVEDPRGPAFPDGQGPARDDRYLRDRGPSGAEDPPRDRGYEQGDRPPGHRPEGDRWPEDPFQRGELYDPNDPGDLDDPAGRDQAGRGYPPDEPEPGPGAYRGRRRGQASSAADAPGPGRGRRDDHVAHHAEGPPWDEAYPNEAYPNEAYQDDAYEDDRFVPGLGGPRHRDDDEEGEDDGGKRRGPKAAGGTRRRRSRWIAPLVALVVILTPLVIGGVYAFHLYLTKYHPADYAGDGTGQTIVQVQSGQTATAVGQRLVTLGVVASVRAFELAAEHSTDQRGLEPGFYRMRKQMKATLAFALLLTPAARIQDKITIPEGWRISQTAAELAAKSGIPAADYQKALADPGSLGLPSYANGNPEGYLWPATYEVQPNMSAAIVLQQMVASFNQQAAKMNLTAAAAQAHMTAAQVITVASLLQAEGGRLSDYAKIARVIVNRLAAGMPLQFDSTVLYGLGQFGTTVTEQQIHSNTAYNTYLHKGLPPGPIDSPGTAAIEAALHPEAGNWLYFVTEKNGVTNFSSTLAGLGG